MSQFWVVTGRFVDHGINDKCYTGNRYACLEDICSDYDTSRRSDRPKIGGSVLFLLCRIGEYCVDV